MMRYALFALLSVGFAATIQADEMPSDQQIRFFETKIRPVLVKHCYSCHSAESEEIKGELQLDTRAGIRLGGESGHAVVPGDVQASLLINALRFEDFEMPPKNKLDDDVINDFVRWVKMGAPDPRDGPMAEVESTPAETTELWSLQPIAAPAPPQTNSDWPRTDIDRFIEAQRAAEGIAPVADADRLTLLRRLSFDLTGLPPTPEQIDQFLADSSAEAVASLIDRLLASSAFGERWGRHWLDVARYGESAGNSRDVLMPYAWRYRDYVIDALNADMPFDQFVREQIAGDLLPADSKETSRRQQIATGFLAIGSKSLNGGNLELDIADDQIDVIGKSMLALTVSCARCHDHKFDPVPTADYYALASIFRSTDTLYGGSTNRPNNLPDKLKVYLPLGGDDFDKKQFAEQQKEIGELSKQLAQARKQADNLAKRLPDDWKAKRVALKEMEEVSAEDRKLLGQIKAFEEKNREAKQLEAQVAELRQNLPQPELAIGVRDAKTIRDWPIQLRGEKGKNGDVAPRGFLSCVALPDPPTITATEQSGRVELAQWITHPEHPLTSRVIVNRVWHHLFGSGLVRTVDNFGVNGEPPSHPELLDYLARRLSHELDWSLKSLIREIVLSRTYQLASDYSEEAYATDAENRLLWRMNRRRLEAEPLRDAVMLAAGTLDTSRPAGSLVLKIGEGEVGRGINTKILDEPFPYRSVYLPIIRGIVPEPLRLFDLPEPSNVQGQRDATNVPAQSLYLLNSPFILEQADAAAARILASGDERDDRLKLLYQICLGRQPSDEERAAGAEFLDQMARDKPADADNAAHAQRAWSMLCQGMFARAEFRFLD
ncbi:MAG: DUF1553 domain-containing protein [Planctomycetales bacterium]|nr:DUF1553 domain-containing protein [Planctomycetales bacterium]